MKDRLFEAVKKSQADYAEIRFEHQEATQIVYRGKEVENVSATDFRGGIVRACTRGGWGLATFDRVEDLDRSVAEAAECARLVGRQETTLADTPVLDESISAKLERDFRGVPFDEKLALVRRYNEIILGTDPAIRTSNVGYGDVFRTVHFASSRGTYYREERPRAFVFFSAVAREGSLVQRASDGTASAVTFDAVVGQESLVEKIAHRAAALLKAPPCEGGKYTVVLDPELAGVFAHEAFGHLSESDFLYENPKMRDLMHLGRPMGVKELNLIDDGSLDPSIGSQRFDDEGTPTRKTYLIRDGILAAHLHSRETAGKMGERPTGNARAIDRTKPPIVRMTNTYIENGSLRFDDLLKGVDKGIYACGAYGGQTMMEMFTFSAGYGYRIENGKVGDLVRDVVLTGNVFETLNAMDGFGNDRVIIQKGSGGCGKGGQSPLPVGLGSPHLRIRDVVVGGK